MTMQWSAFDMGREALSSWLLANSPPNSCAQVSARRMGANLGHQHCRSHPMVYCSFPPTTCAWPSAVRTPGRLAESLTGRVASKL